MLYRKNFGSMNFQEALNQCSNEIGDFTLPIPNSDVENKFIMTLLSDDEKAWLGISDEVWIQIDSTFFMLHTVVHRPKCIFRKKKENGGVLIRALKSELIFALI